MGLNFQGAERFTKRHKELESLYDNLSIADLDVILKIARHLAREHAGPFETHEPLNHRTLAEFSGADDGGIPARKSTPGLPFPDDDDMLEKYKAQILDDSFMKWFDNRGMNYDVDHEWERFCLHGRETGRRFKGKALGASMRLAFQRWLLTPYKKKELSAHEMRQKRAESDSRASRSQELKEQAMKASKATGGKKHWFEIYRGLLKNDEG
jgi:hypothetical protein